MVIVLVFFFAKIKHDHNSHLFLVIFTRDRCPSTRNESFLEQRKTTEIITQFVEGIDRHITATKKKCCSGK